MHKRVHEYIELVEFLGDFLGEDAEIVLHDVTDLENSVVAIKNNHISGRQVGAPATDLVLKILKNKKYTELNYLSNYRGKSKEGKILKAATYFIRDDDSKIVGLLCINMDIDRLTQVKDYLERMVSFKKNNKEEEISETLSQTATELTFENIHQVVQKLGVPAERMSSEEKMDVIEELNNRGIFLVKGALSEVASALKVSEPTIYRYLSVIRKKV